MICDEGIVKVKRWIWSDDWRTYFPLHIPIGDHPVHWTCPTALQVKRELLWQISSLGSELGHDEEALSYLKLYVGKMKKDSFILNEEPKIDKEAPDDWLVNDRTVVILTVNYTDARERHRVDPSINVDDLDEDAKKAHEQQVMMEIYENANYPSRLEGLAMGSGGPDQPEKDTTSEEQTGKGARSDKPKGKKKLAQQSAYDQAVAAAFKSGYDAGRALGAQGPSETSRGSTVKSWEDVASAGGSPKPLYRV